MNPTEDDIALARRQLSSRIVQHKRYGPLPAFIDTAMSAERWLFGCSLAELHWAEVACERFLKVMRAEVRRKQHRIAA